MFFSSPKTVEVKFNNIHGYEMKEQALLVEFFFPELLSISSLWELEIPDYFRFNYIIIKLKNESQIINNLISVIMGYKLRGFVTYKNMAFYYYHDNIRWLAIEYLSLPITICLSGRSDVSVGTVVEYCTKI